MAPKVVQALLLAVAILGTSAEYECEAEEVMKAEGKVLSALFDVLTDDTIYKAEPCLDLELAIRHSEEVLGRCEKSALSDGGLFSRPFSFLFMSRAEEFRSVLKNVCSGTFTGTLRMPSRIEGIRHAMIDYFSQSLKLGDGYVCRTLERIKWDITGNLTKCDVDIKEALQPLLTGLSVSTKLACAPATCSAPFAQICLYSAKSLIEDSEAAKNDTGNNSTVIGDGMFCDQFKDLLAAATSATLDCPDGVHELLNKQYNKLRSKFDMLCNSTLQGFDKCADAPMVTSPVDIVAEAASNFFFDPSKLCELARSKNIEEDLVDYLCEVRDEDVQNETCSDYQTIFSECYKSAGLNLSLETFDCIGIRSQACSSLERYRIFFALVQDVFLSSNASDAFDDLSRSNYPVWPVYSTASSFAQCLSRLSPANTGTSFCFAAPYTASCFATLDNTHSIERNDVKAYIFLAGLVNASCVPEGPIPNLQCQSDFSTFIYKAATSIFTKEWGNCSVDAIDAVNTFLADCYDSRVDKDMVKARLLDVLSLVCPDIAPLQGCPFDAIGSCYDKLLESKPSIRDIKDAGVCVKEQTASCGQHVQEAAKYYMRSLLSKVYNITYDIIESCPCDPSAAVVCYGQWHHQASPGLEESCMSLDDSRMCARAFTSGCASSQLNILGNKLEKLNSIVYEKRFERVIFHWMQKDD